MTITVVGLNELSALSSGAMTALFITLVGKPDATPAVLLLPLATFELMAFASAVVKVVMAVGRALGLPPDEMDAYLVLIASMAVTLGCRSPREPALQDKKGGKRKGQKHVAEGMAAYFVVTASMAVNPLESLHWVTKGGIKGAWQGTRTRTWW